MKDQKELRVVGIDIGSHSLKGVVLDSAMRVIASSEEVCDGVERGVVMNAEKCARALRTLKETLEQTARVPLPICYVAVTPESLAEDTVTVEMQIDTPVDEAMMDLLAEEASLQFTEQYPNRYVLHTVPQQCAVDGTKVLGSPLTLRGTRLTTTVLFLSILDSQYQDIRSVVEDVWGGAEEVLASPVASSLVSLTPLQKNAGSMLVVVGNDTTTATIFEHGTPTACKAFPVGSNTVTEDIALALQVSLEEADRLKKSAHTELLREKKKVLAAVHRRHKSLANDLRLFADSKKRVLPAGIVLTGGGAHSPLLEEHIRDFMRLPTARGTLPRSFGIPHMNAHKQIHTPSFSSALGAAVYGVLNERDKPETFQLSSIFKAIGGWFSRLIYRILP